MAERESILIADDSITVLSMVSARLERSGFDVLSAGDGEEALRLAREHRPRLAILDLEMPGIDGLSLTRELRADPEQNGIRIILLTAHSDDAQIAAGFAAGVDDYITKPFSPQHLQERIEQLLGLR
jgi:DNA-binding response OmpR family regulator